MSKVLLKDQIILITGGTGSFGRHFAYFLLKETQVKEVIVFSRDEYKQFSMQEEFASFGKRIRFIIGDIRDIERLKASFLGVDYVVHAAAMKHVTISEYNPSEAIKTNIIGTQNVIDSAIYTNVKKVVGLSTDKAVNPVNLYGATKLAADKILVAANYNNSKHSTAISVVRFGNFAGSRGSIIPIFQKHINKNIKEFPITHPLMTRYWTSLQETCQATLFSLEKMHGGEIFIPKIPSFKVTDLALAMAPECQFKDIGIRDGERLHEILIGTIDCPYTYENDHYYIIYPPFFNEELKKLNPISPCQEYNSLNNKDFLTIDGIKERLKRDLVDLIL